MIEITREFRPDWVSPPGETIADLLEQRDWSQAELARRIGYTPKRLGQLIKGKARLDEETANRLEREIGGGAGFWLAREAGYRERVARLRGQRSHPPTEVS